MEKPERYETLARRYQITQEGTDSVMLTLAVWYDLSDEAIDKILSLGQGQAVAKHFYLMAALYGFDPEAAYANRDPKQGDTEALLCLLKQQKEQKYDKLSDYILHTHDLNERQICVLQDAVKAGLDQADILCLAKSGKTENEMEKSIEFLQLLKKPASGEEVVSDPAQVQDAKEQKRNWRMLWQRK